MTHAPVHQRLPDLYGDVIAYQEAILAKMIHLSGQLPEDRKRIVDEADIAPLRSGIEDFKRLRERAAEGLP